ncbi:MAG: M17 family peptidase N-terminal domain-containing protein, partial [Legionellales bacterium]
MNYGLTQIPSLDTSECLVLGIFSDAPLPDFAQIIDEEHQGLITKLSQKATEAGDALWQTYVQGQSLLLLQCGKKADFTSGMLTKRLSEVGGALLKQGLTSATLCLPPITQHSADWQLEQMIVQMDNLLYQLLDFKKKNPKPNKLESLTFYLPGAQESTLKLAQSIAESVAFTRDLANMPANICTPTYLAEQALQLTKQSDLLRCKVMGPKEMTEMGMGTLLAVAQGSAEPPRFIEIQYQGGGDKDPIVLVGKGIT